MLTSETPQEACQLAQRAIESRIPGSSVAVFEFDPSRSALKLLTPGPESAALAASLTDATARSCLAIRLGSSQTNDANEPSTVVCDLCGEIGYAICEPLVAAGDVIGSMLITHPQRVDDAGRRTIIDTVAFTTPVLANLRNLALARRHAEMDPLTALPNRRALDITGPDAGAGQPGRHPPGAGHRRPRPFQERQ
jgi:hypothetical protein